MKCIQYVCFIRIHNVEHESTHVTPNRKKSKYFTNRRAHEEPSNALSLPTWMVHWSSLIEWLVAMRLVWGLAKRTGVKEWKGATTTPSEAVAKSAFCVGLTWGMVPLHTSGLCACTYHFFYNAPEVSSLQTLQAQKLAS